MAEATTNQGSQRQNEDDLSGGTQPLGASRHLGQDAQSVDSAETTGRVAHTEPPAPPQVFKRLQSAQQVAAEQPVELTEHRRHGVASDQYLRKRSQPGFGELQADPEEIRHHSSQGSDETSLTPRWWAEVADDSRYQRR